MNTNRVVNRFILLLLTVLIPFVLSTNVRAQPYILKLVADTNTIMPGSDITYEDFGPPVSLISPESETYFGTAGTTTGIYNNVGGTLNVVANNRTPVPGGVGNFKSFTRPEALGSGPDVAFSAGSFARHGVYTWINGVFSVVADSTMVLPGTIGTFSFFLRPVSIGNGDVTFLAQNFSAGEEGIFRHFNGSVELVADTGTPIPGGTGNFTSFDIPVRSENGTVVFRAQGSGGQSGIYIFSGGTLSVIADENTPIPDGTGNFTAFDQDPVVAGGNTVAIEGNGSSSQNGYYIYMGGMLSKIIDRSDSYPGGVGTMNSFGDPIYLGTPGDIAFSATSTMSEAGLFTFIGGVVSVAVDNSDPIPGGVGTFASFTTHYESIGDGDLAFEAQGSGGQRGIYTLIGGVLGLVVDGNTPIPNGLGDNFSQFSFIIDLGDKNVGFRGGGNPSGDGIYDFIGGMVGLVADTRTPVPEGFEDFISLSDPQPVEGAFETSFAALSAGQQGDYTHINFALGLVADKNTPVPGGVFDFEDFSRLDPISIGNDDVAFFGEGTTDLSDMTQQGYYSFINNVLAVVADLDTAIPGGTGDFTGFPLCAGGGGGGGGIVGGGDIDVSINETQSPMVDTRNIVSPSDGNMAFLGQGSGGQIGVYSSIGGVLGVIADTNTLIPGGGGTFTNFTCVVSLGGGEVTFLAETSTGQSGVYATMGGSIILIADTNTAVPDGSGNFESFSVPVSIDNGDIAFLAFFNFGSQGIYRSIGGVLSRVVDFTTPVPGGGGNFFFLSDPVSLGGGDVVFKGINSLIGIYTYIGGTLEVLVDTNTAVPGGSGNFTNFREPVALGLTVGARDVAFIGFVPGGGTGIYSMLPGNLVVVADQNTPIPGGIGNFTQFGFGPTALARRDLAFRAQGDFGQVGIYNAVLQVGSLTIVKETNPPGGTGFGFEGTNFGMQGCGLEGSFTLDDQQFITCANLTPGSFTVQETDFTGYTLSDIDCVGTSSFSETEDSVTVDIEVDDIVVCTFTNTQNFVLNPIFPALDDNINFITAEQALPEGRVAFIWGLRTGSTTIGGRVCNGLELGISNPKLLAIVPANELGVATHIFYIPFFSDLEFEVQLQAIDINTCRESNILSQVIRKDESG